MITWKHIPAIIKNLFKKRPKKVVLSKDAPQRAIRFIVLHCTNTESFTVKVKNLRRYWYYVLGMSTPPFHFLIDEAGETTFLQDVRLNAHGAKAFDNNCIHVAYLGGLDRGRACDTRTFNQRDVMHILITQLLQTYPQAIVLGYCDLPGVKSNCPCFDARVWWEFVKHQRGGYGVFRASDASTTKESTGLMELKEVKPKIRKHSIYGRLTAKKAAH